jgi:hypothetical protein
MVKLYINLGLCGMNSVFIESKHLFNNRNAVLALNSDNTNIHDYRKYDEQLLPFRKLGYSVQLFIIKILFGITFNFIYCGLSLIIELKYVPCFDILIAPLLFGCK